MSNVIYIPTKQMLICKQVRQGFSALWNAHEEMRHLANMMHSRLIEHSRRHHNGQMVDGETIRCMMAQLEAIPEMARGIQRYSEEILRSPAYAVTKQAFELQARRGVL